MLHAALMPQIDVPRARRFFVLRPTELECHLPDGQDAMPLDVMPLATTWVSGNLQRGSEQAIFTIECVGEQKKWVLAAKSVTLARQWIDALESIGVGRDDSKALAPAALSRAHTQPLHLPSAASTSSVKPPPESVPAPVKVPSLGVKINIAALTSSSHGSRHETTPRPLSARTPRGATSRSAPTWRGPTPSHLACLWGRIYIHSLCGTVGPCM